MIKTVKLIKLQRLQVQLKNSTTIGLGAATNNNQCNSNFAILRNQALRDLPPLTQHWYSFFVELNAQFSVSGNAQNKNPTTNEIRLD
nr:hypothetical protein [uncultured bacterium]